MLLQNSRGRGPYLLQIDTLGPLGPERVADVDEEWNPSCLIDATPSNHFLFAGRSPELWFVFFEQGGVAVTRTLITVRRLRDGTYALEGRWSVDGAPLDVASLQQSPLELRADMRTPDQ